MNDGLLTFAARGLSPFFNLFIALEVEADPWQLGARSIPS
jgi:hypothetical protein